MLKAFDFSRNSLVSYVCSVTDLGVLFAFLITQKALNLQVIRVFREVLHQEFSTLSVVRKGPFPFVFSHSIQHHGLQQRRHFVPS
eukprot:c3976_g1_i1 orf=258-512(+)